LINKPWRFYGATTGTAASIGARTIRGLPAYLGHALRFDHVLSARAFSFAHEPCLAVFVTTVILTLAACAPEPSGSATSERTAQRWKPPPDYNRGPQIRNNP
jgi:hypothetical protein